MKFSVDGRDRVQILRVMEERLDSQIAPDMKAQLLSLIDDEKNGIILVDLSKVKYADSSGLGALLLGLRQASTLNKSFAIFGAQKRVRSLLHIARLENVLKSYRNEKEALPD
jgi:anti-sigma B factor antagonist